MQKKLRVLFIGIIGTLGLVFSVALISPSNRYFEIVKNLEIFATLFKEVNEYYVDEVNPSQLLNKGVEEMLSNLDPYTVYISEDKIEDYRTLNTGQYAGIGATTVRFDDRTYISMVYKGFSAHKEGLRIGDEIIKVDGTLIDGLSQDRLNELVKGQAKSRVTLSVKRQGFSGLISLAFEREKVSIPNVPYSGMLENNIGYIKFTEFTPNGYKNIKKALQELLKDDATGIVLDLRNNLGGLLKEAVDISNLFLPADLEVVHTKGKVEQNSFTYTTGYNPLAPDIPVVILVNNMSASASEIVAGTLQDYDRAVLIGRKTYGKGLVQNTRDLPYNSKVKMTIAKYYIPSGRCIQALDYSHRNADGSVGKIPDSLKVEFSTRNGRIVFDGGGIDPEILVEKDKNSPLARQLVMQGFIFRYASEYAKTHDKIAEAGNFNLSDDEYDSFISWVENQNFSFTNPLTEDLEKLKKDAEEAGNYDDAFSSHLQEIESKINSPLAEDLKSNRNAIMKFLEVEIATRYYLESGAVEAGLGDDPYIKRAIQVLTSAEEYTSLLSGAGK